MIRPAIAGGIATITRLPDDVVLVGPHADAEAALVDAAHRRLQHHALAELLGHLDRDQLRRRPRCASPGRRPAVLKLRSNVPTFCSLPDDAM